MSKLKISEQAAIALLLQRGYGIEMMGDLTVYPAQGQYVVSCLRDEDADEDEGIAVGLTPEQAQALQGEGEMEEWLDSPEEAAKLFLKIKASRDSGLRLKVHGGLCGYSRAPG